MISSFCAVVIYNNFKYVNVEKVLPTIKFQNMPNLWKTTEFVGGFLRDLSFNTSYIVQIVWNDVIAGRPIPNIKEKAVVINGNFKANH